MNTPQLDLFANPSSTYEAFVAYNDEGGFAEIRDRGGRILSMAHDNKRHGWVLLVAGGSLPATTGTPGSRAQSASSPSDDRTSDSSFPPVDDWFLGLWCP